MISYINEAKILLLGLAFFFGISSCQDSLEEPLSPNLSTEVEQARKNIVMVGLETTTILETTPEARGLSIQASKENLFPQLIEEFQENEQIALQFHIYCKTDNSHQQTMVNFTKTKDKGLHFKGEIGITDYDKKKEYYVCATYGEASSSTADSPVFRNIVKSLDETDQEGGAYKKIPVGKDGFNIPFTSKWYKLSAVEAGDKPSVQLMAKGEGDTDKASKLKLQARGTILRLSITNQNAKKHLFLRGIKLSDTQGLAAEVQLNLKEGFAYGSYPKLKKVGEQAEQFIAFNDREEEIPIHDWVDNSNVLGVEEGFKEPIMVKGLSVKPNGKGHILLWVANLDEQTMKSEGYKSYQVEVIAGKYGPWHYKYQLDLQNLSEGDTKAFDLNIVRNSSRINRKLLPLDFWVHKNISKASWLAPDNKLYYEPSMMKIQPVDQRLKEYWNSGDVRDVMRNNKHLPTDADIVPTQEDMWAIFPESTGTGAAGGERITYLRWQGLGLKLGENRRYATNCDSKLPNYSCLKNWSKNDLMRIYEPQKSGNQLIYKDLNPVSEAHPLVHMPLMAEYFDMLRFDGDISEEYRSLWRYKWHGYELENSGIQISTILFGNEKAHQDILDRLKKLDTKGKYSGFRQLTGTETWQDADKYGEVNSRFFPIGTTRKHDVGTWGYITKSNDGKTRMEFAIGEGYDKMDGQKGKGKGHQGYIIYKDVAYEWNNFYSYLRTLRNRPSKLLDYNLQEF